MCARRLAPKIKSAAASEVAPPSQRALKGRRRIHKPAHEESMRAHANRPPLSQLAPWPPRPRGRATPSRRRSGLSRLARGPSTMVLARPSRANTGRLQSTSSRLLVAACAQTRRARCASARCACADGTSAHRRASTRPALMGAWGGGMRGSARGSEAHPHLPPTLPPSLTPLQREHVQRELQAPTTLPSARREAARNAAPVPPL